MKDLIILIITFDCYGTLLDTTPIESLIAKISKNNNIDPIRAVNTFNSYEDRLMYGNEIIPYGKLIKTNLEFMDMELSYNSLFKKYYDLFLEAYYKLQTFPEVKSVLYQLGEAGHELVLLSNSSKNIMQYNLKTLDNSFQEVFLPDQTKCYKPKTDFFKYVEKKICIPNKRHIHVAKGFWWDIIPCNNLGWKSIWINRNNLPTLSDIQPTYTLPNLTNLPLLIQNILND